VITLVGRTLAPAVFVLAAACGALAQTPATVPYRPIFEGGSPASGARQTLDVTVNLTESYDDNLLADAGGLSPSRSQKSGQYTSLSPSLDFESHGDRLRVGITAGSNVRYYPDAHQVVATTHYVGSGLTGQFTSRTSLSFNSGVTYAPAYFYGLFARTSAPALGDVVPPATDYASNDQHSYAYTTAARFTHRFSTRAEFLLTANYRYTQFVDALPAFHDFRAYDLGGEYIYSIDRNVRVRLGYTYRNTYYRPTQRPIENYVDAGVEYVRPLSPTRHTQVGFTLGPTLVSGPLAAGDGHESSHYRIVGDAFLEHQIGRTWHARSAYRRGLGYIEGVPAPLYTDAVTAQLSGFLNRRVDLQFVAAYATGDLAQSGGAAKVLTYTGDARLRFGLTREVAAYVDGLFYQYEFERTLLLAPGLPHHLKRTGIRAGFTLWFPVRSR